MQMNGESNAWMLEDFWMNKHESTDAPPAAKYLKGRVKTGPCGVASKPAIVSD